MYPRRSKPTLSRALSSGRGLRLRPTTRAATWQVDAAPFVGHTASVEDLQWSHTEENVFASCSADRSVRIFDTRRRGASMLQVEEAHTEDVNVISWNPLVGFLLASGSDDGAFKIWDLRKFQADAPVAHFKFHQAPVTSIEWSGAEDSVLATGSADHSCIVWDMSLEVSFLLLCAYAFLCVCLVFRASPLACPPARLPPSTRLPEGGETLLPKNVR